MGPSQESAKLNGMHIDNEGNVMVSNRAHRRRKPASDSSFTKATHSLKKERAKNAKQQRKRTTAKLRKARKASDSQVS